MAFKFVILALTLAYVNAGNLIAQPAALSYSAAPAVSSSYFQQASAPVAYAKSYATPAVTAIHTSQPLAYQSQPISYQSQPIAYQSQPIAYQSQPIAYQSQPIAYHGAPASVSVHAAPSVGISQQQVSRSLGGAQSVSTYSKAVDSAFSSVRKYDTRITNDALSYAPAQVAYSAPLITKAYAAPVAYTASEPVAYAAHAPVVAKTYGAPAPVLSYGAPAQVVTKTYAAPAQVLSYNAPTQYAAPAHYAASAHYAAPAQYAAPTHYTTSAHYATPSVYAAPGAYGAPIVTKTYGAPAQIVAKAVAPVATYAAAAPVLAKTAVAYSPSAVVAHTAFQGYGVEYHY